MAIVKQNRTYQFYFQPDSSQIPLGAETNTLTLVEPPFTLEFDITKNTLGQMNHATFRLINMSQANRRAIRFDQTNIGVFRNVLFLAGYGNTLSTVFMGNMGHAWSVRQGTEWVSQIDCYDGGLAFLNAKADYSPANGTLNSQVIQTLIQQLNQPAYGNIVPGKVGAFSGSLMKGEAYNGLITEVLADVTGNAFFIDNGVANCLGDNECLAPIIDTIDDSCGLLGTPVLEYKFVNVEMLFEPRLVLGQLVNLNSSTADASFNRAYKITALNHHGTISGAVCGEAITKVELSPGLGNLQVVP